MLFDFRSRKKCARLHRMRCTKTYDVGVTLGRVCAACGTEVVRVRHRFRANLEKNAGIRYKLFCDFDAQRSNKTRPACAATNARCRRISRSSQWRVWLRESARLASESLEICVNDARIFSRKKKMVPGSSFLHFLPFIHSFVAFFFFTNAFYSGRQKT